MTSKPGLVHIVLEVFKFNRPSDFVFSAAVDEFRVRLTFIQAPTKRIDSIGYTLPEMLLDIFDRYAAVFVGVVKYRCDALLFCLESEHDAKRIAEIGIASWRYRVCQFLYIPVVAESLKKTKHSKL